MTSRGIHPNRPKAIIRQARIKPILEKHPWIMSGSIQTIRGNPESGEMIEVVSEAGVCVGWAHFSPASQIRLRMLSWNEPQPDEPAWLEATLAEAIKCRDGLFDHGQTDAYRLVYSESDGLPGLIVDRYAEYLSVQTLTAGMDRLKPLITDLLVNRLKPVGIIEKNAVSSRRHEGLKDHEGVLFGTVPDDAIEIRETGFRYAVNLLHGQKTGFYLDQRDNKTAVAAFCSGREVLDAFSYTGSFAVHALNAGARSVLRMDNSAPALEAGRVNLQINKMAAGAAEESIQGDVFEALRRFSSAGRTFDLIVLDPPKLAPLRSQIDRAMRAYKDLNLHAMKCLKENGILATFSCSGAVDAAGFQEAVRWASKDAGRTVQILRHLGQGPDHPVRLSFPESAYLKGLICRVF